MLARLGWLAWKRSVSSPPNASRGWLCLSHAAPKEHSRAQGTYWCRACTRWTFGRSTLSKACYKSQSDGLRRFALQFLLWPLLASGGPIGGPPQKETSNDHRNSEVLQRRQGLWLYSARGRKWRYLRAYQRGRSCWHAHARSRAAPNLQSRE